MLHPILQVFLCRRVNSRPLSVNVNNALIEAIMLLCKTPFRAATISPMCLLVSCVFESISETKKDVEGRMPYLARLFDYLTKLCPFLKR